MLKTITLKIPYKFEGPDDDREGLGYYEIKINRNRSKIRISCMFESMKELLRSDWIKKIKLEMPFVYYEVVVFNLYNGHTYMQIEDGMGKIACVRDVTQNPGCTQNGVIYSLIKNKLILKKEIKNVFESENVFCFSLQEITFESLVVATRFLGYNREFYYTIPFCVDEYKIFPGFEDVAKRMHLAKKNPALYQQLQLPTNKTTRRIIFEHPGLMFYYREINCLYEVINNIDYFNKILSHTQIYFMLADMNRYPAIIAFTNESLKYSDKKIVVDCLIKNFCNFASYAVKYMGMSEIGRKNERSRKKWLQTCDGIMYAENANCLPSVVKHFPCESISNCIIDGFEFEWLVSSKDYENAGKIMKNCLGYTDEPVVAVKINGDYYAAIGLLLAPHREITEALLCDNLPIRKNSLLHRAIQKWCKMHSVKWEDMCR